MHENGPRLSKEEILRELREVSLEQEADPKFLIVKMHFEEGLSYRRISTEMGLSLSKVQRCIDKAWRAGVEATLSGRGWQARGQRNRNYGLSRLQEKLLKDRIDEGWGSAKDTQKWLHEFPGTSGTPVSIAAIYGYKKRLAPGVPARKKKRLVKPQLPDSCVALLKERILSHPTSGGQPDEFSLAELSDAVRSKLGAEKMRVMFMKMGAIEVLLPPEVAKASDERSHWLKALGLASASVGSESPGEQLRIFVFERNTRPPRGGAYLRSGFLVRKSGLPMNSCSLERLRTIVQRRFAKVYKTYQKWLSSLNQGQTKRRVSGLSKIQNKLSDFLVLQGVDLKHRWWLDGTGRWAPAMVTAFERALTITPCDDHCSRALASALLGPQLEQGSAKSRKTYPRK